MANEFLTREGVIVSARIGLLTPIVVQHPSTTSSWERPLAASPEAADVLTRVARRADELGYHHLTCSEHIAVPAAIADERGATYFDPVATLAYLAAATTRIGLATNVVVIGYHHPLALAKTYGTLDLLSGGRVILGLGVGSLAEEFALLGAEFEDRGVVADEAVAALRAAWGRRQPRHEGAGFAFSDWIVEPYAVRPSVPLWFGGRTRRSLRRAAEFGTGWAPFGLRREELQRIWASVDRPEGFELILQTTPLDPSSAPEATLKHLARADAVGATTLSVCLSARSADHHLEQLEALHELAPDRFLDPLGDTR